MKRTTWIDVVRWLLILLFVYASASKLMNVPAFRNDMRNQIFPMWMAEILTIAVPLLELVIAGLLIPERTKKWGLATAAVLMGLFTLYTLTVLLRFYGRIPCSCGGVIRELSWPAHLALNVTYLVLSVAALRFVGRERPPQTA